MVGKLMLVLFGILAGWLLSESNRKLLYEKLQEMGVDFAPLYPASPAQPFREKAETKAPQEKSAEVFPDPLEKIKGIGPVIKAKLNDQGVFTFAQLGALSPTELEEMVGASIKRFADEEEIIRQAQERA